MLAVKCVFVDQLSIQSLFEAGWFHRLLWQLWGKKSVIVFLDRQQTVARLPQSVCPSSVSGTQCRAQLDVTSLVFFIKWLQWFDILPSLTPSLNPDCLPYRAQFLQGIQFAVHPLLSTFVVEKQETRLYDYLIRDRRRQCDGPKV